MRFLKIILLHSEYVLSSMSNFIDKKKYISITEKSIPTSLDFASFIPCSNNAQEIKSFIENSIDMWPVSDIRIKNTLKAGLNFIANKNGFFFQKLRRSSNGFSYFWYFCRN